MNTRFRRIPFTFLLYFCTLLLFFLIPPSTDEAYYLRWAQNLQIGYLDHPPLVAWLIGMVSKLGIQIGYAGRLFSILSFFASMYFLRKIYDLIFPKQFFSKAELSKLLTLSLFSLGGMAFYFFWTPDTTLVFLYAACMYFALKLHENSSDLFAIVAFSFFSALSIYAKYTSFFFLTGIFLGFCFSKQKMIKTLFKSFLIFCVFLIPLLYESKTHHGGSFYFLFHRGFFKTYIDPYTIEKQKSYEEFFKFQDPNTEEIHRNFAESFKNLGAKNDASYSALQSSQKFMQSHFKTYLFEYLSSLFMFFGLYSFYLVYLRFKNKIKIYKNTNSSVKILKITVFFYLLFFGIISIFSKVEANWLAPVLMFIPVIYAETIRKMNDAAIQKIAIIHSLLFFMLAVSIVVCLHVLPEQSYLLATRIRKEYFGFKELSTYVQTILESQPTKPMILTQNYQIASMLNFYTPHIPVRQIPGLARPSQWSREFIVEHPTPEDFFKKVSDIIVISQDRSPPKLVTHNLTEMRSIISCGQQKNLEVLSIHRLEIESHPVFLKSNCIKGQNHIWFLSFYSPKT